MGAASEIIKAVGELGSKKAARDRAYDENNFASVVEGCGHAEMEELCSSIETSATYNYVSFKPFLNISANVDTEEFRFTNEELQEALEDLAEKIDSLWYRLQETVLPTRDGKGYTFDPDKMDRSVSDEVAADFHSDLEEICNLCESFRESYKDFRRLGGSLLGL
ncbi:MAG: hypothetical protein AB7E46_02360 [Desulfovibrio sp.]